MYCEGFASDIYSDYILGTLSGPDLAELNSHLGRDCSRCKSELSASRKLWYNVALAVPQVEPSRGLRKRVVGSVGAPRRSFWWQPVAALATLLLAVFAGTQIHPSVPPPIVAILPPVPAPVIVASKELAPKPISVPVPAPVVIVKTQDNSVLLAQVTAAERDLARQKELLAATEREREELNRRLQAVVSQPKPDTSNVERQLTAAQLRTQQLEHDIAEYRSLLVRARERGAPGQSASLLSDPNLKLVRLRVTANGSPAEGHAFISSGSEVLFYASQLPALPTGRAYQLWLIRGSAPAIVSAGIFQPDAQNRATVRFTNAAFTSGITTIAVTDEPEGGSTSPTGHKLLIGT